MTSGATVIRPAGTASTSFMRHNVTLMKTAAPARIRSGLRDQIELHLPPEPPKGSRNRATTSPRSVRRSHRGARAEEDRPYFRDSFTGNSNGNSSSPAGTRSLAMPVSTPTTCPPVAAFQRPDRTPLFESSTGSISRFARPACSRNFSFRPFARGFPSTVSSYAASTNLRSKASGFFSSRSAFSVDFPTPRLSTCVSFTATKRRSVTFIDSVRLTAARGTLPASSPVAASPSPKARRPATTRPPSGSPSQAPPARSPRTASRNGPSSPLPDAVPRSRRSECRPIRRPRSSLSAARRTARPGPRRPAPSLSSSRQSAPPAARGRKALGRPRAERPKAEPKWREGLTQHASARHRHHTEPRRLPLLPLVRLPRFVRQDRFRDQLLKLLAYRLPVSVADDARHSGHCGHHLFRSHLGDLPHEELLVPRPVHLVRARPHLLEQLFAGAHAGKDDLDVLAGSQSGEVNHVAREVDDLHGLAHVQDEDLAPLPHRPG